jgi:hypothetical protein
MVSKDAREPAVGEVIIFAGLAVITNGNTPY